MGGSLFNLFLLCDLKRHAMSKRNQLTIIKSVEVDAENQELEIKTIQNYKNYESTTRIAFNNLRIEGKFLTPSNNPTQFTSKDCRVSDYI
jgi:hypothetical protein